MSETIYIVLNLDPLDGVQVSAAFRYSDEANKYAESFGGKVRQVILE